MLRDRSHPGAKNGGSIRGLGRLLAACLVGSLLLSPLSPPLLSAQDVRWPDPGTRIRITSVPGPPPAAIHAAQVFALQDVPPRRFRSGPDGRIRFLGVMGNVEPERVAFLAAPGMTPVSLPLQDVLLLEEQLGTKSNWKGGLVFGVALGGLIGAATVGGLADDGGVAGRLAGAAAVAAPLGLVGAVIGAVLRGDVYHIVYEAR